jgi:cell volume regulation protein A
VTDAQLILVASALLAAGVLASLVAGRLRLPGLLLFLGLGMAIGTDGTGWIDFADYELARTIGIVALVLILFEGGLAAGWDEIRPVLPGGLSLAVGGTIGTALITGLAAAWLLDLPLLQGLLLGSIVSTTDSAAVFSVLRGSSLRRRVARTLEAESGMNDPVAILLVLGFIEWIRTPGYGIVDMAALFAAQLILGALIGVVTGAAAVAGFRRLPVATTVLYPLVSLAAAGLAFGVADAAGGSGFLAVYFAGLVLGSGRIPARATVQDFHAGLAWISQIALFVTLGLLVFPGRLGDVAVDGLLLAGVLMLVARPAATLVASRVGNYPPRETALLGWAGLRGAVPIVLATFPVIDGVARGELFFDLVFFVVLTSTVMQATTFEPLAKLLGVTTSESALRPGLAEVGTLRRLGGELLEYPVRKGDAIAGQVINGLGLPREALVSIIERGDEPLLPRGSTRIESGDRLYILVRDVARPDVERLFERWRQGPLPQPALNPPPIRSHPAPFSVGPWDPADGDAGNPRRVAGVAVAALLRVRRGSRGVLAQLEDGRFAVTDPRIAAVGGSNQLFRYCRNRIRRAESEEEQAWWQEVAGAISQRALR